MLKEWYEYLEELEALKAKAKEHFCPCSCCYMTEDDWDEVSDREAFCDHFCTVYASYEKAEWELKNHKRSFYSNATVEPIRNRR